MASRKRRNKGSDTSNETEAQEPEAKSEETSAEPAEASAEPEASDAAPADPEPAPEPNKSPEEHHEPNMKMGETFERIMMVNLTPEEKEALNDELRDWCTQEEEKTAEKAQAMSEFNGDLRDIRKSKRAVLNALNTGTREVAVKCREYIHVETNTIQIKRLDTGDVIDERAMTAEERQQELFALEGGKPDPVDPSKVTNLAEAKARRDAQAKVAAESGEVDTDPLPPVEDPLPAGFGSEGTRYTDEALEGIDPDDRPNLERALADDEDEPSGLDVSEDPAGDIERALEGQPEVF